MKRLSIASFQGCPVQSCRRCIGDIYAPWEKSTMADGTTQLSRRCCSVFDAADLDNTHGTLGVVSNPRLGRSTNHLQNDVLGNDLRIQTFFVKSVISCVHCHGCSVHCTVRSLPMAYRRKKKLEPSGFAYVYKQQAHTHVITHTLHVCVCACACD